MDKLHVGCRVRHQNLTCIVVSISGKDCELQPVGSRAVFSAPITDVTMIMNEGTNETAVDTPLYD